MCFGAEAGPQPNRFPLSLEDGSFHSATPCRVVRPHFLGSPGNKELVVRGSHRPILVVSDQGRAYAFDNRRPHVRFPLDCASVEDGILACYWRRDRFDLTSRRTFDLWADDVPTCLVEVRGGEVWAKSEFRPSEPAAFWRHQPTLRLRPRLDVDCLGLGRGCSSSRQQEREQAPGAIAGGRSRRAGRCRASGSVRTSGRH